MTTALTRVLAGNMVRCPKQIFVLLWEKHQPTEFAFGSYHGYSLKPANGI